MARVPFEILSLKTFHIPKLCHLGVNKKSEETRILKTLCCITEKRNQKNNIEKSSDLPQIQLHTVQEGIEHISVLNDDMCQFCGEFCTKVHNDSTRLKIVSRGIFPTIRHSIFIYNLNPEF